MSFEAKWTAHLLLKSNLTVACAESCTGGLLSTFLTDIPGSSAYFMGAVVCYTNAVKESLVGVQEETLLTYGAVSEPTAREMAEGIRTRMHTNLGVGITGLAGPGGGTEEKPVGLVYIAVASELGTQVENYLFQGTRADIRSQAAIKALGMLTAWIERKLRA